MTAAASFDRDAHQHRCGVVESSSLQRCVEERVRNVGEVDASADDTRDRVVVEHAVNAIRAEQVQIAMMGALVVQVDLDFVAQTKRANDDVLRKRRDLLVGDVGLVFTNFILEAVVPREQLELRCTVTVDAAIADVRDEHRLALDRDRGYRRPDSRVIVRAFRFLDDAPVGEPHRRPEAFEAAPACARAVATWRRLRAKRFVNGRERHFRRDVATMAAAHTIAYSEQSVGRPYTEAVLIAPKPPPDIRESMSAYSNHRWTITASNDGT